MRAPSVPPNASVDLRSETGRALAKSALWMIVGYIGASTFTFGLLSWVHAEGSALSALAFVLAGGGFAAYAWRSAYRVVAQIDAPVVAPSHQVRSTSGLTTLIGAPDA
jgi:hypothetical protein